MRAGDLLRQLDHRLLPPLARGMGRLSSGPLRLRVLTGAALLSSVAVLVTAVWAADRGPVGDPTVGEVTRVGVAQGDSIPAYVEATRKELAALLSASSTGPDAQPYALVTFSGYLAPDRLPPVLAGVEVSEVFSRVQLPDTQTQIVRIPALRIPADVIAGMLAVAERKDREARGYQDRRAELSGLDERERHLRDWYDSGARVAAAEATAYRTGCSCVYAAVVRADPSTLHQVSARAEVRAVDPAPEVSRLDRTVFTPPLPEQHDVVRPPVDASSPPGSRAGTPDPTTPAGPNLPGGPAEPSMSKSPLDGSVGPTSEPPLPATPVPTGTSTSTTPPPATATNGDAGGESAEPGPGDSGPSVPPTT